MQELNKKPPLMQPGKIVFFKRAKESSHTRSRFLEFKGHGIGMLLGHIPPFQKDPAPEQLLQLLGMAGFLKFDDVAEFLGDENARLCVKKFEEKYYPKVPLTSEKEESGFYKAASMVDLNEEPPK